MMEAVQTFETPSRKKENFELSFINRGPFFF
jgi:hypothetical protein